MAIQRRVGAPVDEAAATLVDLDEVAMPPNAGKVVEIRFAVSRPVRIVHEVQRHRRGGARHDKLCDLIGHLLAGLVPRMHVHAEQTRLYLARVYGQQRRTADEARAQLRPA